MHVVGKRNLSTGSLGDVFEIVEYRMSGY